MSDEVRPPFPKPDSFLARLRPRHQSAPESPRPTALPFSLTFETDQYAGTVAFSDRTMLSTSADGQISVLLGGAIHRPQSADAGQTILSLYGQRGAGFVRDLDGSFTLLLVDQRAGEILFATDRLNTCKLLASESNGLLTVSNAMDVHPMDSPRLDPIAVASYLIAGFTYTDRTVLDGVQTLEGGSIYRPRGTTLEQERYWQYLPVDEPTSPAIVADLMAEMEAAIVQAVRRRLRADRPVYLSLSAGNDSRGLLGVLVERLQVADVRAFTYTHAHPQPMTDEALAPNLTSRYHGAHRLIQSFNGRLVDTLIGIARLGQGMTDVCDELDTWLTLGAEVGESRPLLFTGDIVISRNLPLSSTEDALTAARMPDFTAARWLEPLIGPTRYQTWVESTRAERDSAVRRCPPTSDYYALHDLLRVYRRHSHVFSTWREYFAGRFFDVVTPLMDADVVDVFLRLPVDLRRDKSLYLQTLQSMFPGLFTLSRATHTNYASYWPEAYRQQAADVRAWIQSASSPLDDLIGPDVLLALLDSDLDAYARSYTTFRSTLRNAYRWLYRLSGIQPSFARPSLVKPVVPAHRILSRALILRSFMQSLQTRQTGLSGIAG